MRYFVLVCFFLSGTIYADFHIQACKDSFNQQNSKLKRIIKTNPKLKDLDTFDPKGILRNFLGTSRVELGLRHVLVSKKNRRSTQICRKIYPQAFNSLPV